MPGAHVHHRFQTHERAPLVRDQGTHKMVARVWDQLHQTFERLLSQCPHNHRRQRLSRGRSLVTLTDEEFAKGVARLENIQNMLIALGRDEADLDGPFLDEIEQIRRITRLEQNLIPAVVTYLKQRVEFAKLWSS